MNEEKAHDRSKIVEHSGDDTAYAGHWHARILKYPDVYPRTPYTYSGLRIGRTHFPRLKLENIRKTRNQTTEITIRTKGFSFIACILKKPLL